MLAVIEGQEKAAAISDRAMTGGQDRHEWKSERLDPNGEGHDCSMADRNSHIRVATTAGCSRWAA